MSTNRPASLPARRSIWSSAWRVPDKVGHAGTLDPLATGVLIVCVGHGDAADRYVQRMPKRYVGTFLLGRRSPTEDIDGEVETLVDPPIPAAAGRGRGGGIRGPLDAAPGLFRPEGRRPQGL